MKTFLESVIDICLMTLWTSGRWKVSLSTFWHLGKTMMSILCSLDFFLSWEETYMRGNYVSLYLICTWFLSCAISSVKMVCLCVAWCEGWECELLMKKALDSNHSYMESRPGSSISWWGWGGGCWEWKWSWWSIMPMWWSPHKNCQSSGLRELPGWWPSGGHAEWLSWREHGNSVFSHIPYSMHLDVHLYPLSYPFIINM